MIRTARRPITLPRRWAAVLAAGTLVAASAVVGQVAQSAPATAASPSTLRQSTESITDLNPFITVHASEQYLIGAAYPFLIRQQPDGSAKPYLADSWTTSSDKLTWTFKIHSGLKWTDGQAITAKDVYWTMNTIMTNTVAGTANAALLTNVASVSAPDDTTFVLKTKAAQANLLSALTPFIGIPIVPEHIWEAKVKGDLKSFANTPNQGKVIGYGPYNITDFKPEQYTILTANKNFFLGAPKTDRLIFQYFKDTDASVQALRSNQIDTTQGVTATQFEALKKEKGLSGYQLTADHWFGIELNPGARSRDGKLLKTNTANPALADVRVRTAIAYAVDRETLVKRIIDGLGTPGVGYIPPAFTQWNYKPDTVVSYNPTKANQILDQAGYKKGSDGVRVDPKTGKPVVLRLGTHSDQSDDAQASGYLQQWLKAIGITLKVEPMSYDVLNGKLSEGDWDILMDAWGTGVDPTYLLSIQTCAALPDSKGQGGYTDAFFCDKTYDQLFDKQRTQFDQTERAQTISQMQDILYKANVDIMLYDYNILQIVRSANVSGLINGTPNSAGVMPLQDSFQQLLTTQVKTGSSSSSSSGGGLGTGPIIGIVVAVVVVIGVVALLVLRRRSTATERE